MRGEPDVVAAAHAAMTARHWAVLRPLLHPYLHWTDATGTVTRGRTRVLELLLGERTPPGRPASVELRDGQVYRWVCG